MKRERAHRTMLCTLLTWVPAAAVALSALNVAVVCAGPLPPIHNEKDLPAKVRAKPVVVFTRPTTGAVYADYVPRADEVSAAFAPAMARNEYEPMQVGLYVPTSKAALKNVTLQLKCPVPCRIGRIYYTPADELDWMADTSESLLKSNYPNAVWPVDPKRLVNKRSCLPLYVLPLPRIPEIRPGRSAAFWVTFHTDESIPAGHHKGTLIVRAEGTMVQTVPFTVTVYPFGLPRPSVHYGMYYLPYQTPAPFQGTEFQELYLADMAAHGMNFMNVSVHVNVLAQKGYDFDSSTPVGPPEDNAWNSVKTREMLDNYLRPAEYQPDGGYNALKLIDNQIRMGLKAGLIQRDHPCVTAPSGYSTKNKATVLETLARHRSARNWPHFLLYMRDEPVPDPKISHHVAEWKRLGAPGIAAMSALGVIGQGHVHSVWTVLAGEITPELLREAGRFGAEVWTYDYNLRVTNVEANRFNAGLYTWSLRLKGNMPFAYMANDHTQAPVYFDNNWKLSRPGGLGFVIPSASGPVPGVGFEGWREGVDDMRYLQLLEARVNAAREDHPVAREVARWLANLRVRIKANQFEPHRYNAWPTDFMDPHAGLDPRDYDAIRVKAAAFIAKLPAAPSEMNPEPTAWRRMRVEAVEADAFAKATIADCRATLMSGTLKQKREAGGALAGREAGEILPARELLIDLLNEPEVRVVALRALANLGPDAAPAIPALRKLLASKDAFIRLGAAYALTRIGPAAAPLLADCAQDPNNHVANLAREALEKLKKQ